MKDKLLLPQEVFDTLIERLTANHKAHRCNTDFDRLRRELEKDAETRKDGVLVAVGAVKIARSAIAKNVQLIGHEYQSAGDELVVYWLDGALEAHAANVPAPLQGLQSLSVTYGLTAPPEGDKSVWLDLSQLPDI